MSVCDICNMPTQWADGFVLTTTEVTTAKNYWLMLFNNPAFSGTVHSPGGEGWLQIMVDHAGNQTQGWMICANCAAKLDFDRESAKNYALAHNANPPGSGPANGTKVAYAAASAWEQVTGYWPQTVYYRQSTRPKPSETSYVSSSNNTTTKSESSSGGCFVATAVYGDYDHPKVKTFRQFRDQVLLKSKSGENFVRFYYKNGPGWANWIKNKAVLQKAVRICLNGFALLLKKNKNYPKIINHVFIWNQRKKNCKLEKPEKH